MVPYATLLIPLYVLLNGLGLQNSLVGLGLVLAMFQLPFAMFMMRISFEAVPTSWRRPRSSTAAARRGAAAHPAPGREARAHHGRPVRVPRGLERLHRPADPDHRSDKAPLPLAIAKMRGQVHGRIDYGATEAGVVVMALPCVAALPGAAALLRPRLHVGRRQGLTP